MKKIISLLVLLVVFVSCKEEKKQDTEQIEVSQEEKERDINDLLVFESTLMKQDIEGAEYKNIQFSNEGALFSGSVNNPSYIKLPLIDLDLSKEFNLSFSFNSKTDDGTKPQTFISFTDKYSSPTRDIPLFVYFAGKRITGVYGNQKLWAEKYDKDLGESKAYYDSYQLPPNEVFFVSLNFSGNSIEIFVNSELYASFSDISPHSKMFEKVILGGLPQGEGYTTLLNGSLHSLKIFSTALTEKEIVQVYNDQPYIGASK
ncbi:LamG domain-containing protein [Flavobacteriaceae bacterium S0862]|jgi:hypothetical protein|nr:LamG domain-containing protein [Flavobacteriaceae bacterium S0862]